MYPSQSNLMVGLVQDGPCSPTLPYRAEAIRVNNPPDRCSYNVLTQLTQSPSSARISKLPQT